jgi:BolA protein
MTLQSSIEEKLTAAFSRLSGLSVINESHLHAGHQPDITGAGETHMRVRIVSASFAGMTRLARHRAITELLKPELDAGLACAGGRAGGARRAGALVGRHRPYGRGASSF